MRTAFVSILQLLCLRSPLLLSEYVASVKDYKRAVPLFLQIFGIYFRMFDFRQKQSRKMCFAACNGRRFFMVSGHG